MKPFFCRVGSKRKFVKALESLFPPHRIYVEAFLGGGAVFWGKTPSEVEVINDLDKTLIADYKRILAAPVGMEHYPKRLTTERAQESFLRQPNKTPAEKLVESILRRCNGYAGRYIPPTTNDVATTSGNKKPANPLSKIKKLPLYKDRLGDATLTSRDYAQVFRSTDSKQTFFFLDPPYEKSSGFDYAEEEGFDFEEFAKAVQSLQGKYLVTINDSPRIRALFSKSNLYPYLVEGHHAQGTGAKDRRELLITNYVLPRGWKKAFL